MPTISFIIGFILGFGACYFTHRQTAREFSHETPKYIWQPEEVGEFLGTETPEEEVAKILNQND